MDEGQWKAFYCAVVASSYLHRAWDALFKKKRVKKEFDIALAEGDDTTIERLVRENPWLHDYVEDAADDTDQNVKRTCAAIGIMEDELGMPVPTDEIAYSLEMDFNASVPVDHVETICSDLEAKGFARRQGGGYTLTVEGGRICDRYLNKHSAFLGDLAGEGA